MNSCPLCHKLLLGIMEDRICQTRVTFPAGKSLPHYENREGSIIKWYLPPYLIKTKGDRSEVYIFDDDYPYDPKKVAPEFKFVMETGIIHPDVPDKVTKRIKNLIIFS